MSCCECIRFCVKSFRLPIPLFHFLSLATLFLCLLPPQSTSSHNTCGECSFWTLQFSLNGKTYSTATEDLDISNCSAGVTGGGQVSEMTCTHTHAHTHTHTTHAQTTHTHTHTQRTHTQHTHICAHAHTHTHTHTHHTHTHTPHTHTTHAHTRTRTHTHTTHT